MTDDEDHGELIYGVAAIAKRLGIPHRSAQLQVETGRLPTFRLGRNVCIRRATLDAWLAEQEAKANGGAS